jgi:hypothetical protein
VYGNEISKREREGGEVRQKANDIEINGNVCTVKAALVINKKSVFLPLS